MTLQDVERPAAIEHQTTAETHRTDRMRTIDIDLPRPRDRSEERFVRYRQELLREFGLH
jgi:ABC-type nitrate/sulfonate/bicarbonate transport system ATPase subunit